jgi:hypothetical protein
MANDQQQSNDQQNLKHTENWFNRNSIIFAILFWAIFLTILYFKTHFDLQGLSIELKILLTIPLPLTGIIRYLNDYHYKREEELLKRMVQSLHGLQAALPIIALLLVLWMSPPCKAKNDGPASITRMLNDSSRSYRNNLHLNNIPVEYEVVIDSIQNYRHNLLLKLLSRYQSVFKCNLYDIKALDSAAQDSLAMMCSSLKLISEVEVELNRIIDARDIRGIDQVLQKYGIVDSARALIRRPGGFSLEDRYSVKNYLIQVAEGLEPPLHIQVVWPADLFSGIGGVENVEFIIDKALL